MSCESARQAITAIYTQPEVDRCICKLVKKEFQEDFKQELFLILLQVPCEKIAGMNGELKYYAIRIIINLVRQEWNVYHKIYLNKEVEYNTDKLRYETSSPAETDAMQERIDREKKEDEMINSIPGIDQKLGNKGYPYHEAMIELINKIGSQRKVASQTGIPLTTVRRTFDRIRKELQK